MEHTFCHTKWQPDRSLRHGAGIHLNLLVTAYMWHFILFPTAPQGCWKRYLSVIEQPLLLNICRNPNNIKKILPFQPGSNSSEQDCHNAESPVLCKCIWNISNFTELHHNEPVLKYFSLILSAKKPK